MARRPTPFLSNADQPSLSDIMADPDYLEQSRLMRRAMREQETAVKRLIGVRDPRRVVQDTDHLGFAEGIHSADNGIKPITMNPVNPRFRR